LAAPPASPKNSRIALRYGMGRVLIVGGNINVIDEATADAVSGIPAKYPKLSGIPVGEWTNAVPPRLVQSLKPDPRTDWRIGDRWQLYPGAGPPVTVVIETVVVIGHGGSCSFRDGAVARFLSPAVANRIAGLRANEFLAVPGAGLANVSQVPILPLGRDDYDTTQKVQQVLLQRAREIVTDENWGIADGWSDEEKKQIRELNRRYLSDPNQIEVLAARWALPGRKPLLFALALWFAEIDGKRLPVFAGESILEEEGDSLKILSFEHSKAVFMRDPEFASWTWDFDRLNGFLNAWRIGSRYFVLRRLIGIESYGIGLQELDDKGNLVETDLAYAF
jgi:hypothetical protein